EDQSLLLGREIADDLGETQLLEGQDLVGHLPDGRGGDAALHVDVGAEPAQPPHAEGEVQLPGRLEALPLLLREDAVRELLGQIGRERRMLHGRDGAVDPYLWRNACGDME